MKLAYGVYKLNTFH